MLKYIDVVKDFFLVFSDFKDDNFRVSEAMVANTIALIASATLIIFGVDLGISEAEIVGVSAGVMAIVGIVLRLRSKGGEVKANPTIKKIVRKKEVLEESE